MDILYETLINPIILNYFIMINSYMDYEWFLEQDLTEYSGKWLAILNKKVVAYGNDVNQVIKQVKDRYPNKKPLITKIRDKLSIL